MLQKFQKVSFTVPVMNSGYIAQFDHLILFFVYNTNYILKITFSFELFSNQKLGIGTSFAQLKTDVYSVRNWPRVFK